MAESVQSNESAGAQQAGQSAELCRSERAPH